MMICVSIKGPTFEAAYEQILQALPYAELVELRLDCFKEWNVADICRLRSAFSLSMILTLRSKQQGGFYTRTEKKRVQDLRSLAKIEPEYLDLECDISPQIIQQIALEHPNIKLILSYHNFDEVPVDLEAIYHEMLKIPAAFYKIAVTPKNSLDAMKLLYWTKMQKNTLLVIGMGLYGQITRILAPILGCPFVFACADDNQQTAPGQYSAKVMAERYRLNLINEQTTVYGLIGDPISLSISDETHNELIQANKFNAVYVKIQLTSSELSEFLHYAKQLFFGGLSVTMPLKESIVPYLDCYDSQSHACGAVNTVHFDQGKLLGLNTDGIGALDVIERRKHVNGKRVVIIGAGGAAKAIAHEAIKRGAFVTIVNRDVKRANEIAAVLNCQWKALDEMQKCALEGYEFLINCTPLSMPIDPQYVISKTIVMDIGTNPKEKQLLKVAKERKCDVIYGYQMFVEQALGQFNHWFSGQLNVLESRIFLLQKAEEIL